MSAEAEKKKNTEAIRRLQKANLDLTNQVKALTRALKSRAADGSQRNVFTGQGVGRGVRQAMIRGGYGTTVRNYEMGGMVGLASGAIAGGLGAAVVGGAQVARAYGQMRALDSNIYMTSGQKTMAQIESVSGMLGGVARGYIKDAWNRSGVTKRADIERGAVSDLASRFRGFQAQGLSLPTGNEAQMMVAQANQIAKQNVEADIYAAKIGGDKGLQAAANKSAGEGLETLKEAIVFAISQGFESAMISLQGQAEEGAAAFMREGNKAANAFGEGAGKAYGVWKRQTKKNIQRFTPPGWLWFAGEDLYDLYSRQGDYRDL